MNVPEIVGLIVGIVCWGAGLMWLTEKREAEPPQMPEGINAWEVRRDARWMKWYVLVWKKYPRGCCEYRVKLATLPFASLAVLGGTSIFIISTTVLIGLTGLLVWRALSC